MGTRELNPADWCTKPRPADKIIHDAFRLRGVEFLETHEDNWPIKHSYKTDQLEEVVVVGKHSAFFISSHIVTNILMRLVDYISRWKRMI